MDEVSELQKDIETGMKNKTADAKAAMADAADRARAKTEELWDDAIDFVRDHPGKSIGLALVAGLAVGALLSAGSREDERLEGARRAAREGEENWQDTKESLARSLEELRGFLDEAVGKLRA